MKKIVPESVTRSPACPNSAPAIESLAQMMEQGHGLCGFCAWGFQSFDGEGEGEDPSGLDLVSLNAGYKSECGKVSLYRDRNGRVGALRDGRFYPGIEGNFAFERYKEGNLHLFSRQ